MKRKRQHVATLNPNAIKSRDLVHLQEITHGTGAGAHKSKKDYNRKELRRAERGWRDAGPDTFAA